MNGGAYGGKQLAIFLGEMRIGNKGLRIIIFHWTDDHGKLSKSHSRFVLSQNRGYLMDVIIQGFRTIT